MSPYGGNVWTQRKKFIQRVMNTHTCISTRTRKGSLGTDRTRKPQWINTHKYMFMHLVCVKYALSHRLLKPKCYPIASKTCFHFAVILSSVCASLAVFGTLVFFFLITQYFLMPDTHDHLYKYLSVMTLWKGQKDEDRGSEKRGSLSVCIVTRKQRQTKVLGHSSQTACPQCLLVTMAYGERCQDIIMWVCVSLGLRCPDREQYHVRGDCVHNR